VHGPCARLGLIGVCDHPGPGCRSPRPLPASERMALVPVDGGGPPLAHLCFMCGEPGAGPCALCHRHICGSDSCSVIVAEPGLAEVVLCVDCARSRSALASNALAGPALVALGAAMLVTAAGVLGPGTLRGICVVAGGLLVVVGLSALLVRWQWRRGLARARPGRGPRDL